MTKGSMTSYLSISRRLNHWVWWRGWYGSLRINECGDVGDDFGKRVFHFQAFAVKEASMRKMVMMRRMKVVEDLNNEIDKRKWQGMVLEMKIEEIVCSKEEIPAIV
ncbi:hypothetical protein Tco_1263149 [Tanacetum coccineum]